MAAITPQMVKELRDKTDAGMGECKKALIEANGDIEAAVDILRKAGIAKSAHRADRASGHCASGAWSRGRRRRRALTKPDNLPRPRRTTFTRGASTRMLRIT